MKRIKVWQSRFIDGKDGHDSSAEFNALMMELAELNPEFQREGDSFWIFYQVEKVECENLVEEREEAGEKAHCIDCPFVVRDLNRFGNIDARKKWATCGKNGERTHVDSRACEEYYKQAERRRF